MGLDGVELVMANEEAFDCRISDAAAEKMLTPRDVIDWLVQSQDQGELLVGTNPPRKAAPLFDRWLSKGASRQPMEARRYSRDEIRDRVFEIIVEQLGVDRVWEDANFVRDLGVD